MKQTELSQKLYAMLCEIYIGRPTPERDLLEIIAANIVERIKKKHIPEKLIEFAIEGLSELSDYDAEIKPYTPQTLLSKSLEKVVGMPYASIPEYIALIEAMEPENQDNLEIPKQLREYIDSL